MPTTFTIKIAADVQGQEAGKSYTMSDEDWTNLFDAYKAMIDESRKNNAMMTPSARSPVPATDADAVRMICDGAMNAVNVQAHQYADRMRREQASAGVKFPATEDQEIPPVKLGGKK